MSTPLEKLNEGLGSMASACLDPYAGNFLVLAKSQEDLHAAVCEAYEEQLHIRDTEIESLRDKADNLREKVRNLELELDYLEARK